MEGQKSSNGRNGETRMEAELPCYAWTPLHRAIIEGPIVYRKLQIRVDDALRCAAREFVFTPANRGTLRERSSPQGSATAQ